MVDGVNLYGYVRGNPMELVDPHGTDSRPSAAEVAAGMSDPVLHGAQSSESSSTQGSAGGSSPSDNINDQDVSSTMQNNQSTEQNRNSSASAFASGTIMMKDTSERTRYQKAIKESSRAAQTGIQAARTEGDLEKAREIAQKAAEQRNRLRTDAQNRLTPGGRALSREIDKTPTFQELVKKYERPDPYETYQTIAEKSGQSRSIMKALTSVGRVLGPLLTFGGSLGLGYQVGSAPNSEKPRIIMQQMGAILVGAIGSSGGAVLGTKLGVLIAGAASLAAGPATAVVVGTALVGGMAGGYLGGRLGVAEGEQGYQMLTDPHFHSVLSNLRLMPP